MCWFYVLSLFSFLLIITCELSILLVFFFCFLLYYQYIMCLGHTEVVGCIVAIFFFDIWHLLIPKLLVSLVFVFDFLLFFDVYKNSIDSQHISGIVNDEIKMMMNEKTSVICFLDLKKNFKIVGKKILIKAKLYNLLAYCVRRANKQRILVVALSLPHHFLV